MNVIFICALFACFCTYITYITSYWVNVNLHTYLHDTICNSVSAVTNKLYMQIGTLTLFASLSSYVNLVAAIIYVLYGLVGTLLICVKNVIAFGTLLICFLESFVKFQLQ